jgi:hypothetical protein
VLTGTGGRASERGLIVRFTVSGRVPLGQQYLHQSLSTKVKPEFRIALVLISYFKRHITHLYHKTISSNS